MAKYNHLFLLTLFSWVTGEFNCENKRCCLSRAKDDEIHCELLGLEDCIANRDICDWDCRPAKTKRRNNRLFQYGLTKKTFKKISKGNGQYRDNYFEGDTNPTTNNPNHLPNTIDDLINYSKLEMVDECGVVYEYEMNSQAATSQIQKLLKSGNTKTNKHKEILDKMRRLTVFPPDDRVQVFEETDVYPFAGYLQFSTIAGSAYRCSASLISPHWIITAGHCVHTGGIEGEWYSEWKFYPGLTSSDQTSTKEIPTRQAWTFSQWTGNNNWFYDIAWIQLDIENSGIEYLLLGNDENPLSTKGRVNIVGYPGDKPGLTKWYQTCLITVVEEEVMRTDDCDLSSGSSGSPVYQIHRKTQIKRIYGIVSWHNDLWNGIARVTQGKYQTICSVVSCDDELEV